MLPFRYRTKADPTIKDIESPLFFTSKELEHLSEVYPGLLYDGDSCTVNLDRYLMKKVRGGELDPKDKHLWMFDLKNIGNVLCYLDI